MGQRWCLILIAVTYHHVPIRSFLRDQCLVQEGLEFTTFYDTELNIPLTRNDENKVPVITISQPDLSKTCELRVEELWKWQDVRLKLGDEPTVVLNGKEVKLSGTSGKMMDRSWKVTVINCMAYLFTPCNSESYKNQCIGCQKRWPVFALKYATQEVIEVPRSGDKEVVRLLSTDDTTVRMKVGEEQEVMCRGQGHQVDIKPYPATICDNLTRNTFTDQIIINKQRNNSIQILKEGLTGSLYIIQCVDACDTEYDQGTNDGYNAVLGFMTTFLILALQKILSFWFCRGFSVQDLRHHSDSS